MKKLLLVFSILLTTSSAMAKLEVVFQNENEIKVSEVYNSMQECVESFKPFMDEQIDGKLKVVLEKEDCNKFSQARYIRASVRFIR